MQSSLATLEKKCKELELKVEQKGKRPAKDDFIEALRAHFMPAEGLPYEELTPMLCFAEWNLKPEEQKQIWRNPSWVAQKKLNGCRAIVHFVKGKGTFIHSRTTSLKNYRMQELTGQAIFGKFVPNFTATIDTEVIIEKPVDTRPYTSKGEVTKTSLHSTTAVLHLEAENARKLQADQNAPLIFRTFDITNWQGKDLRKEPLAVRLRYLESVFATLRLTQVYKYFEQVPIVRENKREFYELTVKEGGEGVVLKNMNSPYVDSSSRRRDAWVKVKKRQEFDAYVVDFKRGDEETGWKNLVGALAFAVKTETGEHVIAWCTNLPLEFRKQISVYDHLTDSVELLDEMYGRVAQVSGQDISARSLRLSHATIDRWRPEEGPDAKQHSDCSTSMADLRAASEWTA